MEIPNLTDDLADEELDIQSVDDVETLLKRLGQLKSEAKKRISKRDTAVVQIERQHNPPIQRRQQLIDFIESGLTLYLVEHKAELLEGEDGKTVELLNGTVAYRKGRSKLVYTSEKDAVIESLRAIGEGKLVRVKETLSKTTLKKAWARIEGKVSGVEMQPGEERVAITARAA